EDGGGEEPPARCTEDEGGRGDDDAVALLDEMPEDRHLLLRIGLPWPRGLPLAVLFHFSCDCGSCFSRLGFSSPVVSSAAEAESVEEFWLSAPGSVVVFASSSSRRSLTSDLKIFMDCPRLRASCGSFGAPKMITMMRITIAICTKLGFIGSSLDC